MRVVRLLSSMICLVLGGLLLLPPPLSLAQGAPPSPGKPVILEFSRLLCPVCAKAEAALQEVRKRYGNQVEVRILHIHKEEHIFKEYRVIFVPTQVFLDASGREVYRHEGPPTLEKLVLKLKELQFIKD